MILTRDNILRFVREKKAVTPTMIAESFDTSTMIASAALSEIAKDKLIGITKLKLASSPYYYDLKQKSYLQELGEKHLSKGEKDIFLKLKQKEILSDNSLSIQEKLAIENIKDFAIPLTLTSNGQDMTFWVWYMRNLDDTRKQIYDALNPKEVPEKIITKPIKKKTETVKQAINEEIQNSQPIQRSVGSASNKTINQYGGPSYNKQPQQNHFDQQQYKSEQSVQNYSKQSHSSQKSPQQEQNKRKFKPTQSEDGGQVENFIENFFNENYLKIENKNKEDKGILYQTSLQLNKMTIQIDCFYFYKKTNEGELIKFYTSSLKPKIVFVINCPKKLLKLSENIENLTIINI